MTPTQQVIAEMREALRLGAFWNPNDFNWITKHGDHAILRWVELLEQESQ